MLPLVSTLLALPSLLNKEAMEQSGFQHQTVTLTLLPRTSELLTSHSSTARPQQIVNANELTLPVIPILPHHLTQPPQAKFLRTQLLLRNLELTLYSSSFTIPKVHISSIWLLGS